MSKSLDKALDAIGSTSPEGARLFNRATNEVINAMNLYEQCRNQAEEDGVDRMVKAAEEKIRKLKWVLR